MSIDKKLLEIIICPKCKGELVEQGDSLVCLSCNCLYKIENSVPILLVKEDE